MTKIRLTLITFHLLFLWGCGDGSGNGKGNGNDGTNEIMAITDVHISCSPAQSLDCVPRNNGVTFYVGLLATNQANCEQEMLKANSGQFALFFDFSGSGVAQFTAVLEGSVKNLLDNNGSHTAYKSKTTHVACSFIDTNGNGRLDNNETIGQLTIPPSEDNPIISDWF